jgi:DNA mismatch repair protein MutS
MIYVEKLSVEHQDTLFKSLPVVFGLAAIDIFTGKNIVYQINSKIDNHLYALQELYRFMTIYMPKELLINIQGLPEFTSPVISPTQQRIYPTTELSNVPGLTMDISIPFDINVPNFSYNLQDTNDTLQNNNSMVHNNDPTNQTCDEILPTNFVVNKNEMDQIYKRFILRFLKLNGGKIIDHQLEKTDMEYTKLSYQEQTLRKLFPGKNNSKIDHITNHLGIAKYPIGTTAYLLLIKYCLKHEPLFLNNLKPPMTRLNQDRLILMHNAIEQLDLFSTKKEYDKTFNSLFDVINKTVTPMGRRFLHERLFNPLNNVEQLDESYARIQIFLDNKALCDDIGAKLKSIPDIEKLHTRLTTGIILPCELYRLFTAYQMIPDMVIKLMAYPAFSKHFLNDNEGKQFNESYGIMQNYIKLSNCKTLKKDYNKLNHDFLNPGIDKTVDHYVHQITEVTQYLTNIAKYLSGHLTKKSKPVELLTLKVNKKGTKKGPDSCEYKEGLYTTKTSYDAILTALRIKGDTQLGYLFHETYSKNCFVRSELIDNQLSILEVSKANNVELFIRWYNQVTFWLRERSNYYDSLIRIITMIDFTYSAACCARAYNYCRPVVVTSDSSFVEARECRHPLKERIDMSIYIPNDITINKECRGVLVEGINGSGKSLLIKTMANCVILAQMGMFVSAKEFKYSPYNSIMTRLSGSDDMKNSKSSFDIEVEELNTLLLNRNKKSLIIVDELCKGTEYHSALSATVSAMLLFLESDTSFMLTTHLHDINNKDLFHELHSQKNWQCFHMDFSTDDNKGLTIYKYKVKPGTSTRLYGLEVAKAKGLENGFLDMAYKFRRRILNESDDILSTDKTRYNSQVYKNECNVCGTKENVHTHHINQQKDADANGFIGHFHKNDPGNMIFLCEKCHTSLHNKEITHERYHTPSGLIDSFSNIKLN